MMRLLRAGLGAGLLWAQAALAQGPVPLPVDANGTERAVYDVLEEHCARCHQHGALTQGLSQPRAGFGHVLDIRRLAHDPRFVRRGDPSGSRLMQVIGPYSYPAMPHDCKEDRCFPTLAEESAVHRWIADMEAEVSDNRIPVDFADLHARARADLQRQPAARQGAVRYLSLRPQHNDPGVSQQALDAYRAAVIKLLNALSWHPDPYRFEAIDPDGLLIRIDLPRLSWTPATWQLLETHYPYGMTAPTDGALTALQQMTASAVPIIRADWMAAQASRAPLYYDILRLPATQQALEEALRLDRFGNLRTGQAARAGFQRSAVALHNRVVERHPLATGTFWTTYEFGGNRDRQSPFRFPLGPAEAFGPQAAFRHDGSQTLFSLPNGFHGYFIADATGRRIDRAPTTLVRDPDGAGVVWAGLSCIACHDRGVAELNDDLRAVAMADRTLAPQHRQQIEALYPGPGAMAGFVRRDRRDFEMALEQAGLPAGLTAAGLEPVHGLAATHADRFIDLARAASELGLRDADLRSRAAFAGPKLAALLQRLDQSPIARDEWVAAFPALLERLTDYRPLRNNSHTGQPLSYSVRQVVGQPGPPPAGSPVTPSSAKAPLTVYTDKPAYRVGDRLRIFVEPREDCRLTLVSIDDRKRSCVLYPHPALPDAVIPGGTQYVFPPRGALRTSEPGRETVMAICNGSRAALAEAVRDTTSVSCEQTGQEGARYADVLREVLTLDLDDSSDDTDAPYRALGTHNPDVAKATVTAVVTP